MHTFILFRGYVVLQRGNEESVVGSGNVVDSDL